MWVSLTFLSLNQSRSSLTLLCNHVLLLSVLLVHLLTLAYFVFSVVDEVTGLDSKNFASRFWLRFRVSRSQERWAGEVSCRTRPSKVNFLFIVTHACRFRRIDSPGNDSFDWPYYWKKKPCKHIFSISFFPVWFYYLQLKNTTVPRNTPNLCGLFNTEVVFITDRTDQQTASLYVSWILIVHVFVFM